MSSTFSWIFKSLKYVLLQNLVRAIVTIKRSSYYAPLTQPDAVRRSKSYLYASRIFKPRNARVADSRPPLIIMVHGGGFIMGLPAADDVMARYLADKCQCDVTTIDYRKAPLHPFPAGYEDVVDGVLALLKENDSYAVVGRRKVILFGCSAGGNLVLGAAQDQRLRGKIHGIMAVYPLVTLEPSKEELLASRPDPSQPDFIGDSVDDVLDLYVGSRDKEAVKDVRISPTNYASRDDLPKKMLFVGCEHDMLCHDAKLMAEKLAGDAESRERQPAEAWHVNDVQWILVKGQRHAFDRFPKKDPEEEARRVKATDQLYSEMADWILTNA